MKQLFCALLIVNSVCHADSSYERYDATKNLMSQVHLTWLISSDIQLACNAEAKSRGFATFKIKVDACSFWDGNECLIITKDHPNNDDVGHEIRHCFQRYYHN